MPAAIVRTAAGANTVNDVAVMDDFIYGEPLAAPAPPTMSDVANQQIAVGAVVGPVAVTVADVNDPAWNLILTASSNNPGLVPDGNVSFGGSGGSRTLFVVPTAGQTGNATITLTINAAPIPPEPEPEPEPTPPTDLFAVGSGAGILATVDVFNADGTLRFTLYPYGTFTGGVTVTTGDLTGYGIDDIITGAGPGCGPHVKVFDGATGAEIRSYFAYDSSFTGGVFVGVGDVSGDGKLDIVTGTGTGGGPHVKVFDGTSGVEIASFFAFDSEFRGGVTVRAGDISGDGIADIVTGAGPGGGPHVKVFDGVDLTVFDCRTGLSVS